MLPLAIKIKNMYKAFYTNKAGCDMQPPRALSPKME